MHRWLTLILLVVVTATIGCGQPGGQTTPGQAAGTPNAAPGAPAATSVASTVASSGALNSARATDSDPGTVTVGSASETIATSLVSACTSNIRTNFNPAVNGVVTAADGSQWTVPAPVAEGPTGTDLYNDCTGNGDNSKDAESQLETVVIDPDGVEITGYLFADNYFELSVNGVLVAHDPIGFTPFNSTMVRFKAKYPMTYAVKLVDWGTHPGIGLEYDEYRVGDGGFIASFSDGTVTGAHWKATPAYIAPLDDPACVDVANGRDSSGCPGKPACTSNNPDAECRALHFAVPADWTAANFDDSAWSTASVYPASEVTNQPAYQQYTQLFAPADFIWSHNLLLDNLVLTRFRVEAPPE